MDRILSGLAAPALAPIWLQLAATVAIVVLCTGLERRYRRRYFLLWAAAWTCHALGLAGVLALSVGGGPSAVFWQYVFAGWSAGALTWAAAVFARGRPWGGWVVLGAFAPVVWTFLAVYLFEDARWPGVPLVSYSAVMLVLAAAALARYDRLIRSPAARYLAVLFFAWALLQASALLPGGARLPDPWSTHLVTALIVGAGGGIFLLVLEDLAQGLDTLTALSAELHEGFGGEGRRVEAMLRRALSLRGVHGSALWLAGPEGGSFVQGAGVAALWPFEAPPAAAPVVARGVVSERVPRVMRDRSGPVNRSKRGHSYTAALPVFADESVVGAVVVVGEARDPFTVVDDRFLLAFGQQVGVALANEELHHDLTARTAELERLQARLVHQHEEERNRIWRELHDETAQVLAALNLQLGVLTERSRPEMVPALDRARTLLKDGIQSIRRVTRDLRPLPLDDLGLVPALRALARDFDDVDAVRVTFSAPGSPPTLGPDAESALYRATQEGLANAVRHGEARHITVRLSVRGSDVELVVEDDGRGLADDIQERMRSSGGLAGIRERVGALGGDFSVGNGEKGGARLTVSVPSISSQEGV